jgi:hypothetical protein
MTLDVKKAKCFHHTTPKRGFSIAHRRESVKDVRGGSSREVPRSREGERITLDKKGREGYPVCSFRDRLVVEKGTARAS